jgi:hypothetical protein
LRDALTLTASVCTAEKDFQSPELESFQQTVEAKAGRAFQNEGEWSDLDYQRITEWLALHIIRNKKSRRELFSSPEDFNRRFMVEFRKEILFSQRYKFVSVHHSQLGRFLITSDHPVVELTVDKDLVRCFAKSPNELVLFSSHASEPVFEIGIEDYFNAMIWAMADEQVYSHRSDLSMARLKRDADMFQMSPVIENIGFADLESTAQT